MRFGFGFILLLLVLGGFAAYVGDRVGMVVGRKRLTIFGIRPKYTSRIVTIVTGVIIVSITLGSLLLISHQARQSLFGLEELQATVSGLSGHLVSLEGQQLLLQEENAELQQQNSALYEENAELERTREALEEKRLALEQANADLESTNAALQRANAALAQEAAELDDRMNVIVGMGMLWSYGLVRAPIVYQANDIIATYVIDVPARRHELYEKIEEALQDASRRVLAAGAGEYTPGFGLVLEEVAIDDEGNVSIVSTVEQHMEELVESIWATPELDSVVFRVLSATHTYAGLPVEPDFRLYANSLIFRAGDTVTAHVFDGRDSGADLLNQVWAWLDGDINMAARERGLLGRPDGKVTAGILPGTLYDVVARIQQTSGPIMVSAVAAQDVYTSDELPLYFGYEEL